MQTQKIKLSLITDKPYSQRAQGIAREDIYNSLPEAYKHVTTIQVVYNQSDLNLKKPLVLKLSTNNCTLSIPYLGKETVLFLLREYENEDVKDKTLIVSDKDKAIQKMVVAFTVGMGGVGYCVAKNKIGYALFILFLMMLYTRYVADDYSNNWNNNNNNYYNDDIRFHTAE